MRLSRSYFYTLRDNPKDEDSVSGRLLVRSGMIKKSSAGIYMYLPLGYKVMKNIEKIIKEEMNQEGATELLMPILIPEEIYIKSGRREIIGNSMFSLKDRYNRDYNLGPTHEELFAIAAAMKIKSYKDMPFNIYQFETKFRDEARPRYGLIRVREFVMKDAYSFDKDLQGLDIAYNKMANAYKRIFDGLGINYKIVQADTGIMGGLLSEEFQAITDIGEDTIVLCDQCDYAANMEIAQCINNNHKSEEKELQYELVFTKDAKTIEEVAAIFHLPLDKFVKTLIFNVDGKLYALLVKGDNDVNFTKVQKLLDAHNIELADFEKVKEITGAEVGFAGPIGLAIDIIVDNEILNMKNFIVGANKTDYHYQNVNLTDFKYTSADIRNIKENDICPQCGGKISFKKGIEVGNIFKLGTKYSKKLGLMYVDENNTLTPVVMGSYGIGLGRCMGAIVEQHHDEKGIIWPYEVAPYKVGLVIADIQDKEQLNLANKLYDELLRKNIDVLFDDRDERLGVKLNDIDLIGIPIRLIVGRKAKENIVEFKFRNQTTSEEMLWEDVIKRIMFY